MLVRAKCIYIYDNYKIDLETLIVHFFKISLPLNEDNISLIDERLIKMS